VRSLVPRSAGPWLAVLTLTAAGTAAAVGYGLTAPKRYRATAQLLVSPVSVNDPTFTGLDVLRDSGGKRTAAASAAALLGSPQVADVVRAELGLARSRDSLLGALDAHVVDSSDVVAVTVEDSTAAGAAQLANAFADGLVKQRTASFQSQLAATIRRDQQLLRAVPAAERTTGVGAALQQRLGVLQGFEGQPDPTIRHAGQASAPASASWPELPKLAATGAAAGLAAGLLVGLLLVLGRAGRRPAAEGDQPYDRGVSDRLVERLEQRVAERIAALETERERLAAREVALAVRERDVSAKLAELRAAVQQAPEKVVEPPPEQPTPEPMAEQPDEEPAVDAAGEELDARAAVLDARVAELTRREIALARRVAEAATLEEEALARTEQLARRAAALTAQLEEAGAKLKEAARQKEAEEAARAAEAEAEAAAVAGPMLRSAAPVAAPAEATNGDDSTGEEGTGHWNLMVLERLVNDRGAEFPDRRDEWASYLYFLREYAEPDGTVPASFDWLIQETFTELVP
jgi:capsular polysaccharide biosynthesis protein